MNPISEKIDAFLKEFDELEALNQKANKEQAEIDKELSNFYHKVEGSEMTRICQSHQLIKELKDILARRRVNKLETILLRSTCDMLRDKVHSLKANKKNLLIKNQEVITEIKTRATEDGKSNN